MRVATTLIVALAVVPVTANAALTQRARYLMGTVCEVATESTNAEAQIEAAFAEAKRIESMLSTWIDDSELSRVNRGAEPSPELRTLLDQTLEWSRRTNRAFDPRWKAPPQFEEGAFGKGYAIDRMLALLPSGAAGSCGARLRRAFGRGRAGGAHHTGPPLHVLINFGGQLGVRGSMRVTIADPKDRDKPVVELTLRDASLSTSSNSEKLHIIDPRTRELLPARGSASVIASDALTADILSTALYVMGEDEGLRWADANGVAAIFITSANQIRLSSRARACGVNVIDGHFAIKD